MPMIFQYQKAALEKKTSKKVAVIQSNYIPWAGYFSLITSVDEFVVYECVQYTKNDWRNRNQIRAKNGQLTWMSIPIKQFSSTQSFMETTVSNHLWSINHFNMLRHHFARTKGWRKWHEELRELYEKAATMTHLYEINRLFLNWCVLALNIKTPIVYLDSYPEFKEPTERLISILENFNTTDYFSGPTAQNYIHPKKFEDAQIKLHYVNYDQLLTNTLFGPRPVNFVSILQLILESKHEFRNN